MWSKQLKKTSKSAKKLNQSLAKNHKQLINIHILQEKALFSLWNHSQLLLLILTVDCIDLYTGLLGNVVNDPLKGTKPTADLKYYRLKYDVDRRNNLKVKVTIKEKAGEKQTNWNEEVKHFPPKFLRSSEKLENKCIEFMYWVTLVFVFFFCGINLSPSERSWA